MKTRDTYLKWISVEMETMKESQPHVERGHHRTENLDDAVYDLMKFSVLVIDWLFCL